LEKNPNTICYFVEADVKYIIKRGNGEVITTIYLYYESTNNILEKSYFMSNIFMLSIV